MKIKLLRVASLVILIVCLLYFGLGVALAQNTSWQRYHNQQQQWNNLQQQNQQNWNRMQQQLQQQQQQYQLDNIERQNRRILQNQRNQRFNNGW